MVYLRFFLFLEVGLLPFILELLLLHPKDFGLLCFYFHLPPCIFWLPLWFLGWPIQCLVAYCLASMYLCSFQNFSCDWFLVSYSYGLKRCLIWFQSFWIYCNLFCGLTYDLFWRIFHVCLKNVNSSIFRWNVLNICVRSYLSHVSVIQSHCFSVDFLSEWCIHGYEWGVKVLYYYCITVNYFLYLVIVALHI